MLGVTDIRSCTGGVTAVRRHHAGTGVLGMRASELEATLSVIRGQADTTPEAKLMMSVFEASVMDAAGFSSQSDMHPSDRDLARRYLRGPMPHLDLAGVNPDWARYKLQQRGMWNELVGDDNA